MIGATTAFEISLWSFLAVVVLLLLLKLVRVPNSGALGAPRAKTARSRRNALPSDAKIVTLNISKLGIKNKRT